MNKTALLNVRVFDGHKICNPGTVVIDGALIGNPADTDGATQYDAKGAILLPGLIDTHVHLQTLGHLSQLRDSGITTAMDMACWDVSILASLRAKSNEPGAGLTSILSAGIPATSPGSHHSRIPGIPSEVLVKGAAQARDFVAKRVSEGSDYIKVIADVPGPDQELLNTLVAEAHAQKKLVVSHAAAVAPIQMSLEAGVDVVTHSPLDGVLDDASILKMVDAGTVCSPTMTMMEGIARKRQLPPQCYEAARETVGRMYKAGVTILAGTDANDVPGVPFHPEYGVSLHHELELLVEAGMGTVDVLRAATVLPAERFGLGDRGVVKEGMRADLVLIEGDPILDITATRNVQRVWIGGVEHIPASGKMQ